MTPPQTRTIKTSIDEIASVVDQLRENPPDDSVVRIATEDGQLRAEWMSGGQPQSFTALPN